MDIRSDNISFQAKLGKNILKIIRNECNGDMKQVAKYEKLFEDAFVKNLDANTIVNFDRNNNYIFSHSGFSEIKYKTNQKPEFKKSFANSLLQECPKTLAYIENKMIRTIISKSIKSGMSFEQLEKLGQKVFSNAKTKNRFFENVYLAKRIKQDFPKSELRDFEFDYMNNLVMEEEAETPGTEIYNLVHNFGELSWE